MISDQRLLKFGYVMGISGLVVAGFCVICGTAVCIYILHISNVAKMQPPASQTSDTSSLEIGYTGVSEESGAAGKTQFALKSLGTVISLPVAFLAAGAVFMLATFGFAIIFGRSLTGGSREGSRPKGKPVTTLQSTTPNA